MGRYLDKLKQFDRGQPEGSEPQAETIIAPDETVPKDREPSVSGSRAQHTVYQSAEPRAKPIYWETGDGQILGPVTPEFLAESGDTFGIVATFEGITRWINADLLRSKRQFEQQVKLEEVERVKECR